MVEINNKQKMVDMVLFWPTMKIERPASVKDHAGVNNNGSISLILHCIDIRSIKCLKIAKIYQEKKRKITKKSETVKKY